MLENTVRQVRGARIAGTGLFVPEKVMTNQDLEGIVDTSDEWIRTRTGIIERRVSGDGVATSELAAGAATEAMEEAGVCAADIEQIIVGTATPDRLFPSTACSLQERLGAANAAAFDLSAACSGFVYGLALARGVIGSSEADTVLVVGAETLTKFMDWQDRSTCVLFGDGAGAAVVTPCEPGRGVLATSVASDGRLGYLLELPAGGSFCPATEETVHNRMHYIRMRGNEVFRNAVRAMESIAQDALGKAGVSAKDLDLLITHQANLRIIQATAKRLGVDGDKVFVNVHKYGNTSAASIPIALHEARREGRVKKGDLVELVAFGAGFTWGAAVIRW